MAESDTPNYDRITAAAERYPFLARTQTGDTVTWQAFDIDSPTGKKHVTTYEREDQDFIEFDEYVKDVFGQKTEQDLDAHIEHLHSYQAQLDKAFAEHTQVYRDYDYTDIASHDFDRRIDYYALDEDAPDGKKHLFSTVIHDNPSDLAIDAKILSAYPLKGVVDLANELEGKHKPLTRDEIIRVHEHLDGHDEIFRVDRLELSEYYDGQHDEPYTNGTVLTTQYYALKDDSREPQRLFWVDENPELLRYIGKNFNVKNERDFAQRHAQHQAEILREAFDIENSKNRQIYCVMKYPKPETNDGYAKLAVANYYVIDTEHVADKRMIAQAHVAPQDIDDFEHLVSPSHAIKDSNALSYTIENLVDHDPKWQDRQFVAGIMHKRTGTDDRLKHASDEIRSDRTFLLELMAYNKEKGYNCSDIYDHMADELKEDKTFLLDAVTTNEKMLYSLPKLRDDEAFLIKAMERNPDIETRHMSFQLRQEIGNNEPLRYLKVKQLALTLLNQRHEIQDEPKHTPKLTR